MDYPAHISDGRVQSVREHSLGTARLSEEFSIEELKAICRYIGLLHDIGKYQSDFKLRITGHNVRVEHAICGALEVNKTTERKTLLALLIELCIAGHHTGIPNSGPVTEESSLQGRLNTAEVQEYSAYITDIPEIQAMGKELAKMSEAFNKMLLSGLDRKDRAGLIEKFAFIVRYCFSCITDADSLDTMNFEGNGKLLDFEADFNACSEILEEKLAAFHPVTEVQKARGRLTTQAIANCKKSAEVYLMNMPTGSGKTLASMRCALWLAREHKLKRIIYVIPYNSIIDQTAQEFERLFGSKANILRHQSSFTYEDEEDRDEMFIYSAKKATENWDADIIITTAVQFFESMYGDKRGKLRKLHNMTESVIVFDEAHMMPREYLQPCLSGIGYLARLFHSKILFLTATMPNYRKLLHEYALKDLNIVDLIDDRSDFRYFSTSRYIFLDEISDEFLVSNMMESPCCLTVMNTRSGAKKIYEMCEGNKFHLSTYMTGYDRQIIIQKIKDEINNLYKEFEDLSKVPEERRIRVVSTSLIEAGVDLDFVTVYRELAGLDNALQSGGRENREGKRPTGNVYIFKRQDYSKSLRTEQSITQHLFKEFWDISSYEAIEAYYERLLYTEKEKIVAKAVSANCKSPFDIDFRTYSSNFKIIDDTRTISVAVVRDKKSEELYEKLKHTGYIDCKAIQKYCCTVYQTEFEELLKQGVLEDYGSGIFFLTNNDYYNIQTGIRTEGCDYII